MSESSIPRTKDHRTATEIAHDDDVAAYQRRLEEQHSYILKHSAAARIEEDLQREAGHLETEERATYYSARSVPVDSAALYKAVNAWVDGLVADKAHPIGIASNSALYYARNAMLRRLEQEVHDAVHILAQTRYQRRRAQQTERLRYADEGSGT